MYGIWKLCAAGGVNFVTSVAGKVVEMTYTDGLIEFGPQIMKSLIVVSRDSGHDFKMMPVFGKWVKNLLDSDRKKGAGSGGQDTGKKDWGDEVSWKIASSREVHKFFSKKRQLEQARL